MWPLCVQNISSFECAPGGTILRSLSSLSESGQQLPSSLVTFNTFKFIRIRNAKIVDQHGKTGSLAHVVEGPESQKLERRQSESSATSWQMMLKIKLTTPMQFQIEAFPERMTIGSHTAVPRVVRAEDNGTDGRPRRRVDSIWGEKRARCLCRGSPTTHPPDRESFPLDSGWISVKRHSGDEGWGEIAVDGVH
ncbi:hypothetical protein BLNAU_25220 [Blattamonas nauphoetae]|uniref:Uncharacterized protein n=1 Tax=Blattamonas nauphoetae TaxID=2049346 RepID=A0ABQ9WK91_9EUKA|nr:hypothetical protein BLNAU_25220 [Blattamonas nauphoetae]